MKCHNCQKLGHKAAECREISKCSACNYFGHQKGDPACHLSGTFIKQKTYRKHRRVSDSDESRESGEWSEDTDDGEISQSDSDDGSDVESNWDDSKKSKAQQLEEEIENKLSQLKDLNTKSKLHGKERRIITQNKIDQISINNNDNTQNIQEHEAIDIEGNHEDENKASGNTNKNVEKENDQGKETPVMEVDESKPDENKSASEKDDQPQPGCSSVQPNKQHEKINQSGEQQIDQTVDTPITSEKDPEIPENNASPDEDQNENTHTDDKNEKSNNQNGESGHVENKGTEKAEDNQNFHKSTAKETKKKNKKPSHPSKPNNQSKNQRQTQDKKPQNEDQEVERYVPS